MRGRIVSFVACASLLTAQPAIAGPKYIVQPVPVGAETARFIQGVPTIDLQLPDGAVQITPLPADHGSLAFGVAVLNAGKVPANIDISNFDISCGAEKLGVFSREELEGKAKKRAMWASIALAAAGGLAAASAASQRDHYTSTFVTPRGTYRSYFSAPSAAGQAQATILAAGTGAGIYAIQAQLDKTRAALGNETLQLTTVDPGDSYAGRIVLYKIKSKALPTRVNLTVNWNGRAFPFAFQLVKPGTVQPVFKPTPPPPPMPIEAPAPTQNRGEVIGGPVA